MENEQGVCNSKTIVALTILCLVGSFITYAFSTKYVFWIGNCLLGHCFSNLLRHGFDKLRGEKKPTICEDKKDLIAEVSEHSLKLLENVPPQFPKNVILTTELADEMIE